MALKGRRFNDIIMKQVKSQDVTAGFCTMHFVKCGTITTLSVQGNRRLLWGVQQWLKGKYYCGEICPKTIWLQYIHKRLDIKKASSQTGSGHVLDRRGLHSVKFTHPSHKRWGNKISMGEWQVSCTTVCCPRYCNTPFDTGVMSRW
jgi:hypothetical protein